MKIEIFNEAKIVNYQIFELTRKKIIKDVTFYRQILSLIY
jgi:hypothetical protein